MSYETVYTMEMVEINKNTPFGIIVGAFAATHKSFARFILALKDEDFAGRANIYWKTEYLDILKYTDRDLYIVRIKDSRAYRKIESCP